MSERGGPWAAARTMGRGGITRLAEATGMSLSGAHPVPTERDLGLVAALERQRRGCGARGG